MFVSRLVTKLPRCRSVSAGLRCNYASYGGGNTPKAHMNDLPIPSGDFQEAYSRKNTKNNTILLAGAGVLLGTIIFVKNSGVIHFNFSPPKSFD